jgi:hypothetical protein
VAEDFPPPPQLLDLEMVEDPDAPQGEDQEGWQVDADQDEAAGYEGIEGDTYIVRGNGSRVLDAKQIDPNNGEQVGGDQEELAEYHRRIREANEGVEDGGDQGELAGGDQGAQGQVATGPGSILSPGNSPPPRVAPALTGPEAIQWKLRQRREEVDRLQVLRDQIEQGELDARCQEGQDREEAHQQAKKLAAQRERTRQKAKRKRSKTREAEEKKTKQVTKPGPEDGRGASRWVQVPMRDDHGLVLYDQSGHVKYHPQDGLQDGQTKSRRDTVHNLENELRRFSYLINLFRTTSLVPEEY